MSLLNPSDHINCYNYDKNELPMIEVVKIRTGYSNELDVVKNEVIVLLEGKICYSVRGFSDRDIEEGQMLLHASGSHFSYKVLSEAIIMIFRPSKIIHLCDNYRIENLYKTGNNVNTNNTSNTLTSLNMNNRLWHFINGLKDCISDGLACKTFFEIKITELFIFFRAYYSTEELRNFLKPILSPDIAFSELVRSFCAEKFYSVEELAKEMNLSSRQFTKRFKQVFDTTPYQWIKKRKVDSIRRELITTNKPIKEIALDFGFGSLGQFTNFCKDEMGKTPSSFRK